MTSNPKTSGARDYARDRLIQMQREMRGLRLLDVYPICSTCDAPIGDDPRVLSVFFYAAGLMGKHEDALKMASKIGRLHHHNEALYVVVTHALTDEELDNLQQAWNEIMAEQRESVHVVAPNSTVWEQVWRARRVPQAPQQAG